MSNVKDVRISGCVPFDAHQRDDEYRGWLAEMNAPAFGLRIEYRGGTRLVPNERGGETTLYGFTISGQEAVSWGALDGLVDSARRAGGEIEAAMARDVENGGEWVRIDGAKAGGRA